MKKHQPIVIVGALALLAAACQSAPPSAEQVVPLAQPATEAATVQQGSEGQSPTIVPVEQEPAAPAVVREGLAATNPATVNLANGTPTLVEFFAFW